MKLRCRRIGAALTVTAFALMAWEARGQDLEPRTYSNIPVGLNFLIAGYGYSVGGVVTDPSFPLEDGDVQIHSTVLAYARAVDVWGTSGKFGVESDVATDLNAEILAEVREHWKGPFQFGALDMIVVNMTKDTVWVRDGVVPNEGGLYEVLPILCMALYFVATYDCACLERGTTEEGQSTTHRASGGASPQAND